MYVLDSYPYVPDSYTRPLHVFTTNANGCMAVINAAQEAGCKGILEMSSAEIYANQEFEEGGLTESSRVAPCSTYGCAKMAVDAWCQTAWKERQTPVLALRQFNAIGTRDITHPYVCPAIFRQLIGQNPVQDGVVYLGNNSQRDFIDADDAMRIAIELLEKGDWGGIYNSGSGESHYIYDIAEMIGDIMGFPSVEVIVDESRKRAWELWNLKSNNSKLYETIEYRPRLSFRESLEETIRWYVEEEFTWPW